MQGRFLCPIATMSRRQAIASALLGVTGGAVCLGQAASSSGLPMVEGESSGLALPTQLESGQWMTNVPAKQDSERGVPLALPPVGARAKRLFLARHGQVCFSKFVFLLRFFLLLLLVLVLLSFLYIFVSLQERRVLDADKALRERGVGGSDWNRFESLRPWWFVVKLIRILSIAFSNRRLEKWKFVTTAITTGYE